MASAVRHRDRATYTEVLMAFSVNTLDGFTDRPSRCRTFYCYSTLEWCQEIAVYYLLVRAYRREPKKRYADFIYDLFLDPNRPVPDALEQGGYITKLNIGEAKVQTLTGRVTEVVKNVRTFSRKMTAEGGGV